MPLPLVIATTNSAAVHFWFRDHAGSTHSIFNYVAFYVFLHLNKENQHEFSPAQNNLWSHVQNRSVVRLTAVVLILLFRFGTCYNVMTLPYVLTRSLRLSGFFPTAYNHYAAGSHEQGQQ